MSAGDAAIAAHRFGLGARPGELDTVGADAAVWLKAQLTSASSVLTAPNLLSTKQAIVLYYDYLEAQRIEAGAAATASLADFIAAEQRRERMTRRPSVTEVERAFASDAPAASAAALYDQMIASHFTDVIARTYHAALTPASFRERLVRFWSDHFTISINKQVLISCGAIIEREAIRPHVTGRFVDMLVAAETHPAMLAYLDNWRSIGPNSPAGLTFGLGLNENLAREILELHTLGVDGGYTQADVTEFAQAITGWTYGNPQVRPDRIGEFTFEPLFHEPGARNVLGRTYIQPGFEKGRAILEDLAAHPATARHVARKLCAHFIADAPPAEAVAALEAVFLSTGGDLGAVSAALVDRPEMWAGDLGKVRGGEAFAIAAMRALNKPLTQVGALFGTFDALGQRPFFAPSPAGWPDDAASWSSPDAVRLRLDWSLLMAADYRGDPPVQDRAEDVLGDLLSDHSALWLSRAASPAQGAALLLMTPEFQRR